MPPTPSSSELDAIVRAIAASGKALRLYPATSPIPRQAVDSAAAGIEAYLVDNPVLAFTVARDGLAWPGSGSTSAIPGIADLADRLRDHGIAEIAFLPGCTAAELMAFLGVVMLPAEEVHASGGIAALLASENVDAVRVTEVQLTVVDSAGPGDDVDLDEFLRDLVEEPAALSTWLAASSAADPSAFREGLEELLHVAEPNFDRFVASFAEAFRAQEAAGKDAVLGLAFDVGEMRHLVGCMLALLETGQIAESLVGGVYGQNMLSLSSALTGLPLASRTPEVTDDVLSLLPASGHSEREVAFLEHMIDVRENPEPEPALVERDPTIRAVADAATLPRDVVARARDAVADSSAALNAASVRTMLLLLDQQHDFDLYCRTAETLALSVQRLVEQGEIPLAARVVGELSARESRSVQPWPELAGQLQAAIATAVGQRTMSALIKACVERPSVVPAAHDLMSIAGDPGARAFTTEAIALGSDGLRVADELLGRRLTDLLNVLAPSTPWYLLRPVAERLARAGDQRSIATLAGILRRGDEQARREVIEGLAAAGGTAVTPLLADALADPKPDVAIVAARALGTSAVPDATRLLTDRLRDLDLDGRDFLLAQEIIGALARLPDSEAEVVLDRLSHRRQLIKRGHYAEVQDLVRQAMAYRARGGA